MFELSDAVAGHVRAAEALARAARLDQVEVAHLVAAMCQRPGWLRDALGNDADDYARDILAGLGKGNGGIPAWSDALRAVIERAAGKRGADELRLLEAIGDAAEGIVAQVIDAVRPLPYVAPDEAVDDDVVGRPMMAPPEEVDVEVATIRIGPTTPTLDTYGRDLIAEAKRGLVRPAFFDNGDFHGAIFMERFRSV